VPVVCSVLLLAKRGSDGKASTHNVHYAGHNPLGSIAVFTLLLVLLFQAISGLFSSDDYYFGALSGLVSKEISNFLTKLHLNNTYVIYTLIALHITAIAFYKLKKDLPLTKAMITGIKHIEHCDVEPKAQTSNWFALILLVICGLLVFCLVNLFTDSLPTPDYSY